MRDRIENMSIEELRTLYSAFEDTTDDENISDVDLKETVKEKIFEGDEGYYEVPIIACPICNFDTMMDSDYITYFQKKFGIKRNDILDEIRDKFKTYDEFCNAMKETK